MVMARKGQGQSEALPKASFTRVAEDARETITGIDNKQALSYGFNDGEPFQRPEYYIRYIEPLESELAKQVEYDMDEQDQEWLDALNKERRADQESTVSYEVFEITMDRLEKEWFELTKNLPKPDMAVPTEDSICAVCDDAEAENSNAIVFCDGCNLAVHQDCYGVPYIPEGQWLCRKCTVSPESTVSCILCPNEGGAFKQTVNGEWAHLLCAIWVPETRVANDVLMEPITGVEKINKQRWKLKCSICGIRKGACIQCSKSSCFLAFHTTCARREKLLMPMKSTQGSEPATLTCFCEKHLPTEQLEIHEAAMAELEESSRTGTVGASKKARAYAKSYQLGPPLVPAIIVNRILEYIYRIKITKKENFLYLMCRYWSLKREARRGAPLLKRLHLEPWATNNDTDQNLEEVAEKLKYLRLLRKDLENVRMLAELTRKRETQKLRQAQTVQDVLSVVFFPHAKPIRAAFEKFIASDRNNFFKNPVSKQEVPDYFDIIKKPMCWNVIEAKIDANEYWNLKDFQDDVMLVLENATTYNKADSPIHRTATRMKAAATKLFGDFQKYVRIHQPEGSDGVAEGTLGDLEPPSNLLSLLSSPSAIEGPDLSFELTSPPLNDLFAYTLGKLKPPPKKLTPPPPKPKRDRKAEAERRMQRKKLDVSAGFRASHAPPRTRRERAQAHAFEAEAQIGSSSTVMGEGERAFVEPISAGLSSLPDTAFSGSEDATRARDARWRIPGYNGRVSEGGQPLVVQDIDNYHSFSMFNEGWILPDDSRRRPRAARGDLPPPRKRTRTSDAQTSTVSSTPANDSVPLPVSSSSYSNTQMPEDGIAAQLSRTHISPTGEPSRFRFPNYHNAPPNLQIDTDSLRGPGRPGRSLPASALTNASPRRERERPTVTVIEKIETPETRREDRRRRKEAQLREKEAAKAAELGLITPPPPVSAATTSALMNMVTPTTAATEALAPPMTTNADNLWDRDSDLTSLGDSDSETDRKGKGKANAGARKSKGLGLGLGEESSDELTGLDQPDESEIDEEDSDVDDPEGRITVTAEDAWKAAQRADYGPGPCLLLEKKQVLEGGTLVWAKTDSYPWWPGVVFEEDDPEVPLNLRRSKGTLASDRVMLLVRFYDTKNLWQWLPLDKIKLFNMDPEWDQLMLRGDKKIQQYKTAKAKQGVQRAYKEAMDSMEASR